MRVYFVPAMFVAASLGCASASSVTKPSGAPSETKLTNASVEGRELKQKEAPLAPSAALDPWDRCPFPQQADKRELDSAVVVARVLVREDGSAQDVEIVRDPGNGFAEAARECAMKQLYVPARDAEGNVVASKTRPFVIRYMR